MCLHINIVIILLPWQVTIKYVFIWQQYFTPQNYDMSIDILPDLNCLLIINKPKDEYLNHNVDIFFIKLVDLPINAYFVFNSSPISTL